MNKTITIIILSLIAVLAHAMDRQLERINAIKKDHAYLYGETTMPTPEEAASISYEMLQKEILNWATQEGSKKTGKVTLAEINQLIDTITTRRANMYRVFAYAEKGKLRLLFFDENKPVPPSPSVKPKTNNKEKTTAPKDTVITEKPAKPVEKQKAAVSKEGLQNLTQHFNKKQPDADNPAKKQPEAKSPVPQKPDAKGVEKKKESPEAKEPARQKPKNPESVMKLPNPQVLEKIKRARNFFELKDIMEPLKKQGDIIDYGKYATIQNPAECYLIVYDPAGNIKALLGKGEENRQNLKTGKADSISNYRGYGAIWFTIKE